MTLIKREIKEQAEPNLQVGDYVENAGAIGIICKANNFEKYFMTRLDEMSPGITTAQFDTLEGLQELLFKQSNWKYLPSITLRPYE